MLVVCLCVCIGGNFLWRSGTGYKFLCVFSRVYLQDGNGKVCRVIRIGTRKSQVESGIVGPLHSECVPCTRPLVEMCSENCSIPSVTSQWDNSWRLTMAPFLSRLFLIKVLLSSSFAVWMWMNGWNLSLVWSSYWAFSSQLARIQTDSVADKLKDLYPDIQLEIGEDSAKSLNCFGFVSYPLEIASQNILKTPEPFSAVQSLCPVPSTAVHTKAF